MSVLAGGAEVTNTYASIAAFGSGIWFGDILRRHNDASDDRTALRRRPNKVPTMPRAGGGQRRQRFRPARVRRAQGWRTAAAPDAPVRTQGRRLAPERRGAAGRPGSQDRWLRRGNLPIPARPTGTLNPHPPTDARATTYRLRAGNIVEADDRRRR